MCFVPHGLLTMQLAGRWLLWRLALFSISTNCLLAWNILADKLPSPCIPWEMLISLHRCLTTQLASTCLRKASPEECKWACRLKCSGQPKKALGDGGGRCLWKQPSPCYWGCWTALMGARVSCPTSQLSVDSTQEDIKALSVLTSNVELWALY